MGGEVHRAPEGVGHWPRKRRVASKRDEENSMSALELAIYKLARIWGLFHELADELEIADGLTGRVKPERRYLADRWTESLGQIQELMDETVECLDVQIEAEEEFERGCADCGRKDDWYTVHNRVWAKAGLDPDALCCLGCLEKRLGRPLTIRDFPTVMINRHIYAGAGQLRKVTEREERASLRKRMRVPRAKAPPITTSLTRPHGRGRKPATSNQDGARVDLHAEEHPADIFL
jgi:hypothetical protein